mmetsp:Transcript_2331/g.5269  ORF Transcript_2331/g.5269 Transcript_2331/m.5269 type:complete len:264 (-) Transcript_2331:89-880(-)
MATTCSPLVSIMPSPKRGTMSLRTCKATTRQVGSPLPTMRERVGRTSGQASLSSSKVLANWLQAQETTWPAPRLTGWAGSVSRRFRTCSRSVLLVWSWSSDHTESRVALPTTSCLRMTAASSRSSGVTLPVGSTRAATRAQTSSLGEPDAASSRRCSAAFLAAPSVCCVPASISHVCLSTSAESMPGFLKNSPPLGFLTCSSVRGMFRTSRKVSISSSLRLFCWCTVFLPWNVARLKPLRVFARITVGRPPHSAFLSACAMAA